MARRFKLGENKEYDEIYNTRRVNSWILNAGYRNSQMAFAGKFDTEGTINLARLQIEGNENKQYFSLEDKKFYPAEIPKLNEELLEISKEFERYCQVRVNEGRKKPETLPAHLLSKQNNCFANLDILEDELALCKKLLKEYAEKKEEVINENCLKYGLKQNGKLRNGILSEIDGQRVVVNSDGVLMINEGIYDGMLVSDYRDMASKWTFERSRQVVEAQQRRLEEMQTKGKSDICIPYSSMTVPKSELPAWPKNIPNYKKK